MSDDHPSAAASRPVAAAHATPRVPRARPGQVRAALFGSGPLATVIQDLLSIMVYS